ncbi:L-serine dehydratase [Neorhizobium galegae]|uniref:L-serine ammonia-lyase n=1 Tax=Neorhizobium galegae TaxID=399 RepID=UPI001AE0F1EC|nr:L-serine ammonia-lyase [Neorhizobium galegae]MBP2562536.1 L-serine dehydratase [Neorhizobium galegae]
MSIKTRTRQEPGELADVRQDNEHPAGFGELFKIGLGPSSSHTVGPMIAAANFADGLADMAHQVVRVVVTLYGSLAWTGRGHGTDDAVILGLTGARPDTIDPIAVKPTLEGIDSTGILVLPTGRNIAFSRKTDIAFDFELDFEVHPNAMRLQGFGSDLAILADEVWFSIGGGFVMREGETPAQRNWSPPYTYRSMDELLTLCTADGVSMEEIVTVNELAKDPSGNPLTFVRTVADTMFTCIDRGLSTEGILPGGLSVKRRAKKIYDDLCAEDTPDSTHQPHRLMDFVSVFAIAVNEENAAGGRVVTAPTNGAAGVIPSVLRYYRDFCDSSDAGINTFLLTAAAIGGIIKKNASISGAEVGCQGEVGSAAAMAAAGLAAALHATPSQIENAAEIAMEHHLGMTCDPIGGLVQIPCIERNAFGAIKAINAASLAMRGDGTHRVSFDQVVETMLQTGRDMKSEYRETSRGGLAKNVPNC